MEITFILKLQWRHRWTQPRIASSCPIAPLKKRFKIVETNNNIPKILGFEKYDILLHEGEDG